MTGVSECQNSECLNSPDQLHLWPKPVVKDFYSSSALSFSTILNHVGDGVLVFSSVVALPDHKAPKLLNLASKFQSED